VHEYSIIGFTRCFEETDLGSTNMYQLNASKLANIDGTAHPTSKVAMVTNDDSEYLTSSLPVK
jgi:hypothetical protein